MRRVLFVPGIPVTQGSKVLLGGRMVDVKSADLKRWRDDIAWRIRAAGWHREPLAGPVWVTLRFVLPRLKTTTRYWHHTKPDLDKLARAVNDALSIAGVWGDDCQAAQLHLVKHHGDPAGVHIHLEQITTDTPQEPA